MHAVVRRGWFSVTCPLPCVSVVLARDVERDSKNVVRCESFVLVVDESLL